METTGAGVPYEVVLFDGMCNFCSGAVRWIMAHEADQSLRFASLQSDYAMNVLGVVSQAGNDLDTIVVVDGATTHTSSDAILRITRHLRWPWRAMLVMRVVPRPVRDSGYRLIARNRYRWFGKTAECMVLTIDMRGRFLN